LNTFPPLSTSPRLNTPAVRDLLWSCFSPDLIERFEGKTNDSIINRCHLELTQARVQWLEALDQYPTPLLDHLSQLKSRRLGYYFEALWQYFINADPQLELLAHNLPVRDAGRTLGEFDIIYTDHSHQQTYHLELAIKFYLHTPSPVLPERITLDQWLGPSCVDRLDKKLHRLIDHQIVLSEQAPAKAVLQSLGLDVLHKEIALKGRLFYSSLHHDLASIDQNNDLCKHHQKATWYHLFAFRLYAAKKTEFKSLAWRVLSKEQWISPYVGVVCAEDKPLSVQALIDQLDRHFEQGGQPLQVCSVSTQNTLQNTSQHTMEYETDRYFITADSWPIECSRGV
jgi:uncharacterized protein